MRRGCAGEAAGSAAAAAHCRSAARRHFQPAAHSGFLSPSALGAGLRLPPLGRSRPRHAGTQQTRLQMCSRRTARALLFAATALACVAASLVRAAPLTDEIASTKTLQLPANRKNYCEFQGERYALNKTWFPKIKDKSDNGKFCDVCICLPETSTHKCHTHKCSEECANPRRETCCQCDFGKAKHHGNTHQGSPAAYVCKSAQKQYRHGEKWETWQADGSCTGHVCNSGIIEYIKCEENKRGCKNPEDCPPSEPGMEEAKSGEGKVSPPRPPVFFEKKEKRSAGCEDQNVQNVFSLSSLKRRTHLEGEKWNPIMGPFGPMYCVICQCKKGRIECSHVCSYQPEMPCKNPTRPKGQCCLTCPTPSQPPPPPPSPQEQMIPVTIAVHDGKSGNSKRDVKKQRQPKGSQKLSMGTNIVVRQLRTGKAGYGVDKFMYAFQKGSEVEVHKWELMRNGTNSKFRNELVNFGDFQIEYHSNMLLGCISKKMLKHIKNREGKIQEDCTGWIRKSEDQIKQCGTRIKLLLNHLEDHAVPCPARKN
ncbi:chordin-like protein 2 isoform X2 [Cloeon dipterum]|uniref:chordin-like protein 2 isoform X2 n=1 Tax=Cloeon dipterum TaxID=197152 RepID=UPI0032205ECB